MAPQNKRQVEDNEEVCKRLKEDIKDTTKPDAEAKDVSESEKHNNNNNNNTKAPQNDGHKNGSAPIEHEEKKESGDNNSDQNNGGQKAAQANGDDKKAELETETKPEEKQEETKKEPETETEKKSTTDAKEAEETPAEEPTTGHLLICGGANWDMTGRKELPKTAKKPVEVNPAARNLWGPHRVLTDDGKSLRVKGVFSGCNACHSVIVTDDGKTMTFGRNDKGQLGLGNTDTKITPAVVEVFKDIEIVAAACGRSHTLFLDSNGIVYACGDNKMGQCGTNQQAVQQITTPVRIAFKPEDKPIVKIACGAEFSMIVDEDGKLYSFGHPEHGQLGHNSEGKYFTSGNKYAFHCEYAPRRVVTFIEKSRDGHVSHCDDVQIVDVACGTNHTLAVDKKSRCFSWGFAGYHRLGHSETKNELVPRSIKLFDAPPATGRGASRVFAGATHSMALDNNGLLYFWGQNKSSGEATMYPKNVQDLCGWRVKTVSCANRSIFVIAEDTCISWGPSPTYGELGYGEGKSKSSTTPQEVKSLDGVHAMDIACGFGHTLIVARDDSSKDKTAIEKLPNWP